MTVSIDPPNAHDARRELMVRLARTADTTSELVKRYLAVRHQCERTLGDAHELRMTSRMLREELHTAVATYIGLLRNEGTPQDLAIWLVKDVVQPTGPALDSAESEVVHDLEDWATYIYHAA